MSTVGERIRAARKAKGMTQRELGERTGYTSRSTIAKIEAGVNDIPRAQVAAFAEALDCTVAYLMGQATGEGESAMEMNILTEIGDAAAYEQLAEECVELAHAALKMARVLRKENPTPVDESHARGKIFEELGDLMNALDVVEPMLLARAYMSVIEQYRGEKMKRWEERIRAAKKEGMKWMP